MRLFACLFALAAFAATAPHALAQAALSTPEASPARKDPLGFGDLSRDRPKGSLTEITAQKEATFDEKENLAIFFGDVHVKDPAFLLNSDKLTVYLTKDRSGIDKAVAEGNVVIVQQTKNSSEKPAVGRARTAEYVPATGRVVLSGLPEIQQGINRHIATSPETRMILNRTGRSTTEGPSKTVITDTDAAAGQFP